MKAAPPGTFFCASFPALGSTAALVLADARHSDTALEILRAELDAMDRAASRFRADSELVALNAAAGSGRPVEVTGLLFEAIAVALRAAKLTGGLVDPTVGRALELVGYDRDFSSIDPQGPALRLEARPVAGWRAVKTDPVSRSVLIPHGVVLDLGATAKALCADRAASRVASSVPGGVLVGLGGDLSAAGEPPAGGWPVRISDNHADPLDGPGPVISMVPGGLATSSTTVRRWIRGGETVHHLLDPATGLSAPEYWRTATVAAASCVDANIASCASVLLGAAAPDWLDQRGLPARLVHSSGTVTLVGGWPVEDPSAERADVTR